MFENSRVIPITPQDFTIDGRIKTNSKIGIICFVAHWCGHCIALEPEFAKAANILGESMPFYFFDCVKYQDFARNIGISSFPTIFVIDRQGKINKKYTGGRTSQDFLNFACKETRKCF